MDVLTKKQRHKNMLNIKSKDTKVEILLRKALWAKGIRYRKNYNKLSGKPDIVLMKFKIAIFVDGDFWHARGHEKKPGQQIKTNKKFWTKKLERNVERDKEVNEILIEAGWLVLRFWENDIKKDLQGIVKQIRSYTY